MLKNKEKGSALIITILVVLVLTMVGIASLFFMTTEERIANVSRLERSAFYAAETGLRAAETSILNQYGSNTNIGTTLLSYQRTTDNVFQVPNGGTVHPVAVVLTDANSVPQHNDPITGELIPQGEMRGIDIFGNNAGYTLTYSVYVRNDDDELSETVDNNRIISVVSVGTLVTGSGLTIRKVLEEMIGPSNGGGAPGTQQGQNTGGTGSTTTGGSGS